MLMGYDGLNLPYDVPATQYLMVRGSKASTSRGLAIWANDFLSRYDADALRYHLAASMPENADSDFTWPEFLRRNNDELVATWGNLVHRVLTFTHRHFDEQVPDAGELDDAASGLLKRAEAALAETGEHISACRFRAGLGSALSLAQEANRYLDEQAPWRTISQDRQAAARSLYVVIGVINTLKTALYPYLPFSSERLHGFLGYEGTIQDAGWRFEVPSPGQRLSQPEALFKKLDPSIVDEEEARLLAGQAGAPATKSTASP
jgi:methionyl-tRNA synthetase